MSEIYEGCFKDQYWRLNHLYWIEVKSGPPRRFRMNWAQEELFRNLWTRNNILKARQLGMSTLTALMILDGCLFRENWHAGVVDKTLEDAKEKLRKMTFALDCMAEPPMGDDRFGGEDRKAINRFSARWVKLAKPQAKATDIFFVGSKSSVKVGTSLRGATLQFLHISEFGCVAANQPKKALKILGGAVNTVDSRGVIIMESTHEGGKYGENYRLTKAAMEMVGRKLSPMDFKFFFFPWWRQPEYSVAEPGSPVVDAGLQKYFGELEKRGITLDDGKKRWYASQCRTFGYMVRQEYPSTPEEAFESQVEGSIYGGIISDLRSQGRIRAEFEADDAYPLYVSWDIGLSDQMSLWLVQPRGDGRFYVLDHYTAHLHPLSHYFDVVRRWEAVHGQRVELHLLPHDSAKRDPEMVSFDTRFAQAGFRYIRVPRVPDIWAGIHAVRDVLRHCVFHERCSEPVKVDGEEYISGINALENYQKLPVGANGAQREMPLHNACSHSADAFRTFAEGVKNGFVNNVGSVRRVPGVAHNSVRRNIPNRSPWAC